MPASRFIVLHPKHDLPYGISTLGAASCLSHLKKRWVNECPNNGNHRKDKQKIAQAKFRHRPVQKVNQNKRLKLTRIINVWMQKP